MATHKLQITLDGDTLTVTHRCTVDIGGQAISHAEPVTIADKPGAIAALQKLIDGNRKEMEDRTLKLAVSHAAAVSGKVGPNTKALTAGGSLGTIGATDAKK